MYNLLNNNLTYNNTVKSTFIYTTTFYRFIIRRLGLLCTCQRNSFSDIQKFSAETKLKKN